MYVFISEFETPVFDSDHKRLWEEHYEKSHCKKKGIYIVGTNFFRSINVTLNHFDHDDNELRIKFKKIAQEEFIKEFAYN